MTAFEYFAAELQAGLPSLLDSRAHSDLTIWCEDEKHHVHKLVMCAHSPYFTKTCTGEFREAKSGKIKFVDDDPLLVKAMVEAIYHGDYFHIPTVNSSDPLQFHVKVYAIADKYDIKLLRRLAQDKFEEGCKDIPDLQSLARAIEEVYRSTPSSNRGLRDIVIDTATTHREKLWKDVDFNDMTERVGEFVRDFAKHLCTAMGGGPKTPIKACGCRFGTRDYCVACA